MKSTFFTDRFFCAVRGNSTRLAIALTLLLTASVPVQAADNVINRNVEQLKVAFVYNFSKYFSWRGSPKNDLSVFTVCVSEQSREGGEFTSLNGESTQGKTIEVKGIASVDSDAIARDCHILYVSDEEFETFEAQISEIDEQDVLVVSDRAGSNALGSVVELVQIENRVKFRINRDLVEAKGLNVSSLLLRLALN